ncbi:hypothetical protein EVAR_61372_1 [Eumeta japonica]|uniref:Uncharacterized protein n=1 Tax=Eumeta variegata TaxID=151549 RepID=A0A4C1ZB66_EUMVA|nr:hypothetical protein EVAR_61372_1 [Eumeta japonica]
MRKVISLRVLLNELKSPGKKPSQGVHGRAARFLRRPTRAAASCGNRRNYWDQYGNLRWQSTKDDMRLATA